MTTTHLAERELSRLLHSGRAATIEQLTELVAEGRGRPIELVEFAFPARGGMSGLWIAQKDADVIAYAPSSALRRDAIIGHELGHMLCGHELQGGEGLDLQDIDVARYLAREHYGTAREAEAERMGTLIAAALRRPAQSWASSRLR